MNSLSHKQLALLLFSASTALAVVTTPYHFRFDGKSLKLAASTALAESGSGGSDGGGSGSSERVAQD